MNRITRNIIALAIAAVMAAGMAVSAATPVWEEVTSPRQEVVQMFEMEGATEVVVRDGYIYVWSQKPVKVQLFSILGQQIHQETVGQGIHRLRLNTKGIFILRAGSLTRRITL